MKKGINKNENLKRILLAIALVLGIVLFLYFVYEFGQAAIEIVTKNFHWGYLLIYALLTLFAFVPLTMRFKVILSAYGEHPSFWILLKQTIATYTLSYITPAVRIGGEPLRAYMLKKECNIDYKTGSSSIILDKFVEFFGSLVLAMIGLVTMLVVPGIPWSLKILFIVILIISFFITLGFYFRTIMGKGSFSSLFEMARLHKIRNWQGVPAAIREVESMAETFFKEHKMRLFISSLFYLMTGIIFFLEIKFLLLSFGISSSIVELILVINIWGLVHFLPVPGALGFLEATQTTLFEALKGEGSVGLALALLIRVRSLFVVALGFLLISQFSGKLVLKEFKEKQKQARK
ncbi:MAG: lysylphosphatidylglycerol synthase transmembrane domain-containing protein [archaeon]